MRNKRICWYIATLFLLSNGLLAQPFLARTFTYEGNTREYNIYLPDSYDGSVAFPLLFNFHGGGGDIASQIAIADMRSIADTADFILVYPQALPDPNDDGSTNWLHKEPTEVDDVFFIDALIVSLSAEYEIDQTRIYACGYSLGGEFTYELACRLNEQIAAVGVVARTMFVGTLDNCAPSHPTGVLTILGTDDSISPYDGLEWGGIQYYHSAEEVHNYWVDHNNASTVPTVTQLPDLEPTDGSTVERYVWADGDACVSIEHLKVNGGGHDWPGSFGNKDIDASVAIWNFVSQYDLDGRINCGVTSSQEVEMEDEVLIYPNPVADQLRLQVKFEVDQTYQIYSPTGQLIVSGELDAGSSTIDLSNIPPGTYVLKITGSGFRFVKL
ncbi:MAG: T9SS type A sorting domain-containing protein [Bacteroidota bacterium]